MSEAEHPIVFPTGYNSVAYDYAVLQPKSVTQSAMYTTFLY